MLFIIGKTLSVSKKIIPGIYVINAPLLPPRGASIRYGAFNREERITQNSIQRGVSIRYWAFIGSWAFARSFTVSDGGVGLHCSSPARNRRNLKDYDQLLD